MVHTRRKLENMLQGALELLDMHLPLRIALGQAVGTKRLVDAGIDRELIAIDLRANGVEMHVGIAVRNLDGIDVLDFGLIRTPEHILGELIDGRSLGTLGNTDGERLGVDVENIAALDMPLAIVVVPDGATGVIGMVAEHRFVEDYLAIALIPVHAVHGSALAHDSQGITGEIRGGHGEEDHVVALQLIAVQAGKRAADMRDLEVAHIQSAHGSKDKLLVVLNRIKLLDNGLAKGRVGDAGLTHELRHELCASALDFVKRLSEQLFHIDDLGASAAKKVGKLIVLFLGIVQIERVVNPNAVEILRLHVYKIHTGAMDAHLLEGANLAMNVQSFVHLYPSFSQLVCGVLHLRQGDKTRNRSECHADNAYDQEEFPSDLPPLA